MGIFQLPRQERQKNQKGVGTAIGFPVPDTPYSSHPAAVGSSFHQTWRSSRRAQLAKFLMSGSYFLVWPHWTEKGIFFFFASTFWFPDCEQVMSFLHCLKQSVGFLLVENSTCQNATSRSWFQNVPFQWPICALSLLNTDFIFQNATSHSLSFLAQSC